MISRVGLALLLMFVSLIPASAAVVCTPLGQLTSVLQLCKPAAGETGWDAAINNNWTILDALFGTGSLLKPLNGGTGVNGSVAVNGTLLIGNGTGYTLALPLGTTNQVSVTAGAGSLTFSTPQNIDTAATVQHGSLGLGVAAGAAGTLKATTSVTIGGATPTAITNVRVYSQALTPSQMAAAIAFAEQTFSVTGLTTADKISVNPGGAQGTQCAFVGTARVSAADTLALTFFNSAASLCTPASSTYLIMAIRS